MVTKINFEDETILIILHFMANHGYLSFGADLC